MEIPPTSNHAPQPAPRGFGVVDGARDGMLRALSKKRPQDDAASPGPAAAPRLSRSRRHAFRLAAFLLPFLVLLLLELALRMVGFGYPTQFFLKGNNASGPVLLSNPEFTRRFFPPGLERTPLPIAVRPGKLPGTVRVVVFGESAAMGDPAPAFGFGRILEVLLEARHPGQDVEIVNVATTAINSHVLREIARDCRSLPADFWILYIGNNEVVGPYGAGTVFSERVPSLGAVRTSLALRSTRVGQLMDWMRGWFATGNSLPTEWGGMEMFLDHHIPAHDPALERVYDNFQRNLEEIIGLGRRAGAHVLASTVVANLKDCAPFASVALGDELEATLIQAGLDIKEGSPHLALARLLETGEAAASSAMYHYLMGRSELDLENQEEARRHFIEARDLDTLRFRVDSRLNRIIQQTAVTWEGPGLSLVDAEAVFEWQYPHRIVGGEYLYEHVHFHFAGHYLLARTFAEEMEAHWPGGGGALAPQALWPDAQSCADALGYTAWAEAEVLDEMIRRLGLPPFLEQAGNDQRVANLRARWAELHADLRPDTLPAMREVYASALERSPRDWELREQYGLFLEAVGSRDAALEQWRQVLAVVPNHFQARYHLANTLDALGRSEEAIPEFRKIHRERPASTEALNGLALALDNEGKSDEAIRLLRDAIGERPGFVEAHINLGQLLARQGQVAEAERQYMEALKLRTNSVAAHVNLGKLLAAQGRGQEAERQYRAALATAPNNAVARYNLGNLLSARQDPEAARQFEAAVRADPGFAEARVNWGLALAAEGRDAEAMEQFTRAIALNPSLATAHLNLGVALARQRRLAEAIPHFEATLKLEPDNESAREFLAKARAMVRE